MINGDFSPNEAGGASLAYLGDAVLETLTREYLIKTGVRDVGKLNSLALSYVKATAQSKAIEKLLPLLSEEEAGIFKRGRNAHGVSIPKSASAGEYRRATGMEALFGWLYLNGKVERMRELFRIAYSESNET